MRTSTPGQRGARDITPTRLLDLDPDPILLPSSETGQWLEPLTRCLQTAVWTVHRPRPQAGADLFPTRLISLERGFRPGSTRNLRRRRRTVNLAKPKWSFLLPRRLKANLDPPDVLVAHKHPIIARKRCIIHSRPRSLQPRPGIAGIIARLDVVHRDRRRPIRDVHLDHRLVPARSLLVERIVILNDLPPAANTIHTQTIRTPPDTLASTGSSKDPRSRLTKRGPANADLFSRADLTILLHIS